MVVVVVVVVVVVGKQLEKSENFSKAVETTLEQTEKPSGLWLETNLKEIFKKLD